MLSYIKISNEFGRIDIQQYCWYSIHLSVSDLLTFLLFLTPTNTNLAVYGLAVTHNVDRVIKRHQKNPFMSKKHPWYII